MDDAVLFHGGPIRTFDSEDSGGDPAEALLVDKGRVVGVGPQVELRRQLRSTTREIDLEGRTLAPGFIDAHAHMILHGSGVDWVDLSGARSVDEVVTLLQARASLQLDGVIRGYGYDHNKLAERRHPTAADLRRVSDLRPIQIQHASGHGYVVNQVVLDQFAITAGTPTPDSGRIDRDDAGRPTGVLFDSACDLLTGPEGVKVTNHGPNFHLPMGDEEVARLFDLAQQSFLAAGITTLCDAQVTELEMAAYLNARDAGQLQMRAHLLMLSHRLSTLRDLGLVSRLGDDRLELYGVKLYADGAVTARTAYMNRHSCCGNPKPEGYLYHEPQELAELIGTAHALGLRTATHAQGEEPIGLVVDAVEAANRLVPRPGLRHRIEHCGFPNEAQIARMAQANMVPVPQPMQVHQYADSLISDFGEYGGRFYPYGSFERHGLPIVVSSDAPVTMPGPLKAAWAAMTRETIGGDVAGDTTGDESQVVGRMAALRGITSTPAALLDRTDIGSLNVGAQADLVVLDGDPVTAPVDELPAIKVTETWVAGDQVWSRQPFR